MSWPPHLTVATVVERDGKFLVVEEEVNGQLVINQPAGHLEPDETLFAAAHRETLEETGWEIELEAICGVYHYHARDVDITYHRTAFAARAVRQTERALDPDIRQALWLTLDELKERTLRSELVIQSIEDYLAGTRVPLDLLKHVE